VSEPALTQGDLFALDSPLLTGVRGERSLMAFPFLSKGKGTKPLAYKTDTVSIYDKEVLRYIASLLLAKLDAGAELRCNRRRKGRSGWIGHDRSMRTLFANTSCDISATMRRECS